MSAKSLLQIVGVNPAPATLEKAALVLIDMQDEYLPTGLVPLHGVEQALERGQVLLQRARASGTPVIHVVHHGEAGKGFYDPEAQGGQFNEKVKPIEGEPVVPKHHISAFVNNPDMLTHLQNTGRKELIVIGFMTHMCVSTFVRAAVEQYGFSCTVVAEATAARALPNPAVPGQEVAAPDVQATHLAALSDFFCCVVPSTDDIKDN